MTGAYLNSRSTVFIVLFFLKIVLIIQGLLCFYKNFRIICSSSVKNSIAILIEIALNLCIALGDMDILTALIFLIQGHAISFHLFASSSDFFTNLCSFHSTGIAIPKLNLFLSTLSFWFNCKGDCFLNSYFWEFVSSVQFSSVTQSCMTLFDPKDCSMPGFPVHHQLLEIF